MSIERVKRYFARFGMEKRVWEFDSSSATVELAAETLGVRPARIAKTLSFKTDAGCMLIVAAGDARIDNHKFKELFHFKARMLPFEEVEPLTGYAVGGVCPFDMPEGVPVYLDVSLRRFGTVFPACGSDNSAIELDCDTLYRYADALDWIDVCKDWDEACSIRPNDALIEPLPPLSDGEIRLERKASGPADERKGYVPFYRFDIVRESDDMKVGLCDLRLGYVRFTYYGGNIGYEVYEPYRGHRYAEKACRLLLRLADMHAMPYVIISCDEKNLPSRRTLEALGGELLETRVPPSYTELYQNGARSPHCIFRVAIR